MPVATGTGSAAPAEDTASPSPARSWRRRAVPLLVLLAGAVLVTAYVAVGRTSLHEGYAGGVWVTGAPNAAVSTPFGSATVVQRTDGFVVERLVSVAHDHPWTVHLTDVDHVRSRALDLVAGDECRLVATSADVTVVEADGTVPRRVTASAFDADVPLRRGQIAFLWVDSTWADAGCDPTADTEWGSGGFLVDHRVPLAGEDTTVSVPDERLLVVSDLDAWLDGALEVTRSP